MVYYTADKGLVKRCWVCFRLDAPGKRGPDEQPEPPPELPSEPTRRGRPRVRRTAAGRWSSCASSPIHLRRSGPRSPIPRNCASGRLSTRRAASPNRGRSPWSWPAATAPSRRPPKATRPIRPAAPPKYTWHQRPAAVGAHGDGVGHAPHALPHRHRLQLAVEGHGRLAHLPRRGRALARRRADRPHRGRRSETGSVGTRSTQPMPRASASSPDVRPSRAACRGRLTNSHMGI